MPDPDGFVFVGIKPVALLRLLEKHPQIAREKLSTSAVCHTILKPMTVPHGWVDKATLVNAAKGWYKHQYHPEGAPDQLQDEAPHGTRSFADLLHEDLEQQHLVGRPTVFWSHPWMDKFEDVVTAMAEQYPDEFVCKCAAANRICLHLVVGSPANHGLPPKKEVAPLQGSTALSWTSTQPRNSPRIGGAAHSRTQSRSLGTR